MASDKGVVPATQHTPAVESADFQKHVEQRASLPAQRPPCRACGKDECPRRHNIERQEEVVAALWEFAANLQLRPTEGGGVATVASGQKDAGTKCGLDHVGTALNRIMEAFNYGVLRVD